MRSDLTHGSLKYPRSDLTEIVLGMDNYSNTSTNYLNVTQYTYLNKTSTLTLTT
jgi:hypothetical protein